jgi:hypothetical protein
VLFPSRMLQMSMRFRLKALSAMAIASTGSSTMTSAIWRCSKRPWFSSAAGGKYGGRKVRSGNIFGYHLWPRASTRLKPRSITSVCLPESRYEGLSTAPSHGHVRNDLPSKFTSAVNSSPAALSPRSLPTSKSNQKRVNVHCYGNEHC